MNFIDSIVKIQHDCPFSDLSSKFPDVEMSFWCNDENDILQIIPENPDQIDEILAVAKKTLCMKEVMRDSKSVLTTTRMCQCYKDGSVSNIAAEFNCWMIPPMRCHGGYEIYRIIASKKSDFRNFVSEVKKIGKIDISSLKERDCLDILAYASKIPVHLFGGLTDKQLHTIVDAYEKGLLDVPSHIKMDDVADREGISRSTYGEHLRKAIHQIIQNSYPMLKLYDSHNSIKASGKKKK